MPPDNVTQLHLRNTVQPPEKVKRQYKMAVKGDTAEILLYGPIGWSPFGDGITLVDFQKDLKALGNVKNIDLRINSDGGDVFEGRAIYSLLAEHKAKVTVHVDGLAASVASLIAMAGKEIRMADGAFMMIHDPWGVVVGNAAEMMRMSELLNSVADTMANTYAARSKTAKDTIRELMREETWMTAKEALDRGFATQVAEPVKAAASVREPDRYKHLPSALRPKRAAAARAAAQIAALVRSAPAG